MASLNEDSPMWEADVERNGPRFNEALKFANSLKVSKAESRSSISKKKDPFKLIQSYGSIASDRAMCIADFPGGLESDEFKKAELEVRLWQLVEKLYRIRKRDVQKQKPELEYKAILWWLQTTVTSPRDPNNIRSIHWMGTKEAILQNNLPDKGPVQFSKTASMSTLKKPTSTRAESKKVVDFLDQDAPLRESKGISQEDLDFDSSFFKYLFELIRTGNIEKVLEMCEATGNWYLRLAVRGSPTYLDAKSLDFENLENDFNGKEKRRIWRRMCIQLSQNTSIHIYERAFYGFLGGDLDSALSLSDTWETQFLAYMNSIVASQYDKGQDKADHVPKELTLGNVKTPQAVLDILAHSSDQRIVEESKDTFRILMGAVIVGTVPFLLDQTATELTKIMEGSVTSSKLIEDDHILRVLTHLVLFLQDIGQLEGDPSSVDVIVRSYTEYLKLNNEYSLVPLYASYLPREMCVDAYSFLLANIEDSDERKQQLYLAKVYDIDIVSALRLTVIRAFEESSSAYSTTELDLRASTVTNIDVRLYKSVEWFKDASLYGDAIKASVRLLRTFLSAGHHAAAAEYDSCVGISTLLKAYQSEQIVHSSHGNYDHSVEPTSAEFTELAEYDALVQCLNTFTAWDEQLKEYVGKSANGDVASRNLITLIEVLSAQVYELSSTWLEKCIAGASETVDYEMLNEIRTQYIPFLIENLLKVLIQAEVVDKRLVRRATELSILVANEDYGIYKLFVKAGTLERFLAKLARAVLDEVSQN